MGVLGTLLGSKSNRDIKAIDPIVSKIQAAENDISGLSNEKLRGKTAEFKDRIAAHINEEEKDVVKLKTQIEAEEDIMEREKMWEQVDKIDKSIYDKTQDILNDILPEAFAVMKETAKRFKENKTVEVTATDNDRLLEPIRDGLEIKGSTAVIRMSGLHRQV